MSKKLELKINSFKWMALTALVVFVAVVLFLPSEEAIEFSQKVASTEERKAEASHQESATVHRDSAGLWASVPLSRSGGGGDSSGDFQVNHNTSMLLGSSGANSKVQLHAGARLPLRLLDKFTVAQESVPVLAELLLDSMTDSGLRLPAGTRFYGEASFQKGSDRVRISFKQVSLPSGQMRQVSAMALGKDGQLGIAGDVHSDGAKNTAGQLITTFVSGLAAGSVETDMLGRSRGGVVNGLLSAVAETSRGQAQSYGEKLKTEREWAEVAAGTECDALLNDSINLQSGEETR